MNSVECLQDKNQNNIHEKFLNSVEKNSEQVFIKSHKNVYYGKVNIHYINIFDIAFLTVRGIMKREGNQIQLNLDETFGEQKVKYFLSMVNNIFRNTDPFDNSKSIIYFFDIADKFRLDTLIVDRVLNKLMNNNSLLNWTLLGEICEYYENEKFGPHIERLFNFLSKFVQYGNYCICHIDSKCFLFVKSREIIIEYFSRDETKINSENILLEFLINKIIQIKNEGNVIPLSGVYELLKIVRYFHVSRDKLIEELRRLEQIYGEVFIEQSIEDTFEIRKRLVQESPNKFMFTYTHEMGKLYTRESNRYMVECKSGTNLCINITTTTLEPTTILFNISNLSNNKISLQCIVPKNKIVHAKIYVYIRENINIWKTISKLNLEFTKDISKIDIGESPENNTNFLITFKNLYLKDS